MTWLMEATKEKDSRSFKQHTRGLLKVWTNRLLLCPCFSQIVTWTQCRWIPRLEVLSKAFDLSRFEKLVLVNFVAKHFAKVGRLL